MTVVSNDCFCQFLKRCCVKSFRGGISESAEIIRVSPVGMHRAIMDRVKIEPRCRHLSVVEDHIFHSRVSVAQWASLPALPSNDNTVKPIERLGRHADCAQFFGFAHFRRFEICRQTYARPLGYQKPSTRISRQINAVDGTVNVAFPATPCVIRQNTSRLR